MGPRNEPRARPNDVGLANVLITHVIEGIMRRMAGFIVFEIGLGERITAVQRFLHSFLVPDFFWLTHEQFVTMT